MIYRILRWLRLWPDAYDEKKLESMLRELDAMLERLPFTYTSVRDYKQMESFCDEILTFVHHIYIPKLHPLYKKTLTVEEEKARLKERINKTNEEFIASEIKRCDVLLSDIHGKKLDYQQCRVVVTDADRNLVIAGAGSGKTLTIEAKVKYLCEEKGITPQEILLISYTKESAKELSDRISNLLNVPVRAVTFHKLGLDIISWRANNKPHVHERFLEEFVRSYFENNIINKPTFASILLEYFAYYFHVPADLEKFGSLGAAYEYEKGRDRETIRGKIASLAASGDPLTSFKGEKLKSLQEVSIANFLFLHGVDYRYEMPYEFVEKDPFHKPYRPDFYLPDYKIYIEHFGINKEGHAPWLTDVEERKYIDGIRWKREIHKKYGTSLIETYSFYSSEGCLFEKLEMKLKKHGVSFQVPDFNAVFNAIYPSISKKYFPDFIDLCCTFITLFDSAGCSAHALDEFILESRQLSSPFMARRTALFCSIIKPILQDYKNALIDQNAVDFSDMINKATRIIMETKYNPFPYKWIIVDEYQDISVARYKLIRALLDKTEAKLLCVGDDWQSIFRFAGSDISLFTRFEDFFGETEIMKIEKTYRNSQQLIDIAGSFVMKNPSQITKKLHSDKEISNPIVIKCYSTDPTKVFLESIRDIITNYGDKTSILVLGRIKRDLYAIESDRVQVFPDSGRIILRDYPNVKISFNTVHAAKGREADNVILLNFKNNIYGFPNKIVDDPLLDLVLTQGEDFLYAEERRLFYVALTRTKNRIYILMDRNYPSEFFREFERSEAVFVSAPDEVTYRRFACPLCKTGDLRLRNGRTGRFVGCSNFPQCNYTLGEYSAILDPQICPVCQGLMVKKENKYGIYYQCTNMNYCGFTKDAVKYRRFEGQTGMEHKKVSEMKSNSIY